MTSPAACVSIEPASGLSPPVGQLAPPSTRLRSGGALFDRHMTRSQIIAANDELRQHFHGGRIEVCHGPYEIDDRTMGRMLCAIAKYDKFSAESLHDHGVLIFAGFSVAWNIEIIDGERVVRVWINEDVLHGA
jgi:hypothetical protein